MTHTTLDVTGNLDTRTSRSPGAQIDGMDALHGYFWGLIDAAQFAFTMLSILVGLAFVLSLVL